MTRWLKSFLFLSMCQAVCHAVAWPTTPASLVLLSSAWRLSVAVSPVSFYIAGGPQPPITSFTTGRSSFFAVDGVSGIG